jgi:hypothetical protein
MNELYRNFIEQAGLDPDNLPADSDNFPPKPKRKAMKPLEVKAPYRREQRYEQV